MNSIISTYNFYTDDIDKISIPIKNSCKKCRFKNGCGERKGGSTFCNRYRPQLIAKKKH